MARNISIKEGISVNMALESLEKDNNLITKNFDKKSTEILLKYGLPVILIIIGLSLLP